MAEDIAKILWDFPAIDPRTAIIAVDPGAYCIIPDEMRAMAAREIERLRTSELAWKLIAKQEMRWSELPQSEKEAALAKALESATADFIHAEDEIECLREQLSHGMPAIDELTKEREMYRMRWLGSLTREEAALIRAENERLRSELETALYRFRFIREGGEAGERALRLAIPDIEHALSFNGEQSPTGKGE